MRLENILAWDARFTAGLRIAEKPGPLRVLAAVLAHSGDSWFWILGLALVWWRGEPHWQARAWTLGLGVLVTALVVMILKFTIRRRRPEGEWGNLYRKTDPHSFPSGHAARAVMLATIALGMGPPWLAALLSLWAPLVGLARVAMGVHYLSDVLAGALLGVVMGVGVLVLI
jgi:undecaprenyl-diphosphatase